MQEFQHRLTQLSQQITEAWEKLQLDQKIQELQKLEQIVAEPELWADPHRAKLENSRLKDLQNRTEPWVLLKAQVSDITELLELGSEDLFEEISHQITALENEFTKLEQELLYNGPHDHLSVILRLTAGVGGTEAMDWTSILERMYLRYFEKTGLSASLIERTVGEEAGIKTAVYEISGLHPYGTLKSEHGVHRLVRLSPFNADNLRQTSFALVEILPVLEESDLKIEDKDLRIDVYRSGGHGGQSVNTTDSAVRITHLPTGTVVAIQNERSQLQNRSKALEILRGKLLKMQQEQQAESIDKLRAGESAKWGQQIRNYVLQPYKLVKDTRTKHEETDAEAVLDGEIDNFILAYLKANLSD